MVSDWNSGVVEPSTEGDVVSLSVDSSTLLEVPSEEELLVYDVIGLLLDDWVTDVELDSIAGDLVPVSVENSGALDVDSEDDVIGSMLVDWPFD